MRPEALRRAFEGADPEPIIALLEEMVSPARRARLWEVMSARLDAVTLVMDAPHDPHNGAAVLRSCDAFGVQRVHVVERHHPFGVSSAVAKGTERWVDVIAHARAADVIDLFHFTSQMGILATGEGHMNYCCFIFHFCSLFLSFHY